MKNVFHSATAFKWVQYLCEGITLHDAVRDAIHLQVHANVEVLPQVVEPPLGLRQALAFDSLSLRNARVWHRRLHDAHGVVLQVVVDDHRPDAVVLLWGVEDVFLEVAMEAQHL